MTICTYYTKKINRYQLRLIEITKKLWVGNVPYLEMGVL